MSVGGRILPPCPGDGYARVSSADQNPDHRTEYHLRRQTSPASPVLRDVRSRVWALEGTAQS